MQLIRWSASVVIIVGLMMSTFVIGVRVGLHSLGFTVSRDERGIISSFTQELNSKSDQAEVGWVTYYSSGEVIGQTRIDRTSRATRFREWSEGRLRLESYRDGGTLVGMTYYTEIVPQTRSEFNEETGRGDNLTYYRNGKKAVEYSHLNNVLDGVCTYYHENGAVAARGVFEGGVPCGTWRCFSANGAEIPLEELPVELKSRIATDAMRRQKH